MSLIRALLIVVLCAWAGHAAAGMPKGEYLDGKDSKVAVILAHGQGLDADAMVVGPLRRAIHKELGYHTLSLAMPTLPGPKGAELFEEYASTFPDAFARIQAAIDFLRNERGVERIYLMGHSMGGRMTTAFVVAHPEAPIAGLIGVGWMSGGPEPLNTNLNLRKTRLPAIDIYAENDRDAQFAAGRRAMVSERYVQVPVPGATHSYRGFDKVVADAVNHWLSQREAR